MDIKLDTIPIQCANFELTEFDEEIILFSPSNEKAIYLNQTARIIWQLCDGNHSITQIIQSIINHYPNEPEIESHILDTLKQMSKEGTISLKEQS